MFGLDLSLEYSQILSQPLKWLLRHHTHGVLHYSVALEAWNCVVPRRHLSRTPERLGSIQLRSRGVGMQVARPPAGDTLNNMQPTGYDAGPPVGRARRLLTKPAGSRTLTAPLGIQTTLSPPKGTSVSPTTTPPTKGALALRRSELQTRPARGTRLGISVLVVVSSFLTELMEWRTCLDSGRF